MSDEIDKLLTKLSDIPKPVGLDARLFKVTRRQIFKRATYAAYAGVISSAALVIWSALAFFSQLRQTPSLNLFKLLFIDFGTVRHNFLDWSLAVVESMSLDYLLLLLMGTFFLIVLIYKITANKTPGALKLRYWPGKISQGLLS